LKGEFVYPAVILDGFSRKIVGWAVDRTLIVAALDVADTYVKPFEGRPRWNEMKRLAK